jgi:hypothetical protein
MKRRLGIVVIAIFVCWTILVIFRQYLLKRHAVRALGVSWPLPPNQSIDVPVLTFALNPFGPDPGSVYFYVNGNFEKIIVLNPNENTTPSYGNQ